MRNFGAATCGEISVGSRDVGSWSCTAPYLCVAAEGMFVVMSPAECGTKGRVAGRCRSMCDVIGSALCRSRWCLCVVSQRSEVNYCKGYEEEMEQDIHGRYGGGSNGRDRGDCDDSQ